VSGMSDAMNRFAEPLLELTDGSIEHIRKAMATSAICWNLALMPDEHREPALAELRPSLNMDDAEFADFKHGVLEPMIARHREMFPGLHRGGPRAPFGGAARGAPLPEPAPRRPPQPYAGTGRNERCPCGSGKKYKVCCGR
jgi:hypothetical protein